MFLASLKELLVKGLYFTQNREGGREAGLGSIITPPPSLSVIHICLLVELVLQLSI